MRVSKNKFLVEVDEQFVIPKINGIDFFVDTDYNPKALATKTGRIHTLPITVTEDFIYDNKLNVGDRVVFSHLVCQKINRFAENVFFCSYHNIYAKVMVGELQPLEDIFFCEKMKMPDTVIGAFTKEGEVSDKYARVFSVSNYSKEQGVEIGDIVFFTKNADYEMDVNGKSIYKMHLRNVIAIERDGELKTFRNRVMVKNITQIGSVAGVEKIYAQTSLQTGVVLEEGNSGVKKGSLITYFAGIASEVNWNGQNYSFVRAENIKYIQ